jgi:hypothetical protein
LGLEFGIWGLTVRVQDLRFRDCGSKLRIVECIKNYQVKGLGFRV